MNATYLVPTTTISAQTISDRMPNTFGCVAGLRGEKHWENAYSGLVPISPKTTPSAASARGASFFSLLWILGAASATDSVMLSHPASAMRRRYQSRAVPVEGES